MIFYHFILLDDKIKKAVNMAVDFYVEKKNRTVLLEMTEITGGCSQVVISTIPYLLNEMCKDYLGI